MSGLSGALPARLWICPLQLLLLLSAMLAGLTGLISGERSSGVERASVAAVATAYVAAIAVETVVEETAPRTPMLPALASDDVAPGAPHRPTPREAAIDGRWLV